MKAVVFDTFGPPSVLRVAPDHPRPLRKSGEVLVEITSTSVNPIDYKTRKGEIPRALVKLPNVRSLQSIIHFFFLVHSVGAPVK